jgi:hypothetical protein
MCGSAAVTDPMEGAIGDGGEERCTGSCQRITSAVILHLVVKIIVGSYKINLYMKLLGVS